MTEVRAGVARPARLLHALAGERVEPPACGVSFVDPRLLGDAGEAAVPDGGAAALAR
jgi:hypothetical protein